MQVSVFDWGTRSTKLALSACFSARGLGARAALSAKQKEEKMESESDKKLQLLLWSFLSSSSDSDEAEEIVESLRETREKPKIKNFIEDVVNKFTNWDFQANFRLKRSTTYWLIEEFKNSKFVPQDRSHGGKEPVSAEKHILMFLWFAGNKCVLRDVAQRFDVSISTLHTCIERVIEFFLDMAPSVIKMPSSEAEKSHFSAEFQKISGVPNILGCIDGTSINMRTPAHKVKSTYTNRHDVVSVTLQGICDYQRRFIDVFTGTPGKIHDSRVFRLSEISSKLPKICGEKYHILADNAYALRDYILTPYKDYGDLSEKHKYFNKSLSACRVLIENTFGILKGRFRQLQHLDMHSVIKVTKFIIACCVLHNLCIDKDDFIDVDIDDNQKLDQNNEEIEDSEIQLRRKGEKKRDAIKDCLKFL